MNSLDKIQKIIKVFRTLAKIAMIFAYVAAGLLLITAILFANNSTYQLMASITHSVGIHEGTILNYHQTQMNSETYYTGLENLQYDILYGDRYCYDGIDKYPATDIVMGIDETRIDNAVNSIGGSEVIIYGENFTKWSKVFVNGEKVSTIFTASDCLVINREDIENGDTIVVNQMGSGNTIFRSSNEFTYVDPDALPLDTEATMDTEVPAGTEVTDSTEGADNTENSDN